MANAPEAVEYPCSACGAVNRIPRQRVLDDPKCGRCHQKVFPRQPVPVGAGSWRAEVEESPIPVLADFWAEWCGPCRAVAPVLESLAREHAGRLKVVKVNTEEEPQLASRFGIRSIPTLMVFRGPLVLDQIVGALPQAALEARLSKWT
jgi:thioredoxin 2